ncbi:hypothetical protein A2783_00110 [Microgenomates group bacterium RIFCSPHIGHO2_01_FULL_45_11]|nr:MAG: hypothetical protein A2783_00110 [Microgenomates group bacterium RIFCSPHIGHO2_01_FULL_45_11]
MTSPDVRVVDERLMDGLSPETARVISEYFRWSKLGHDFGIGQALHPATVPRGLSADQALTLASRLFKLAPDSVEYWLNEAGAPYSYVNKTNPHLKLMFDSLQAILDAE